MANKRDKRLVVMFDDGEIIGEALSIIATFEEVLKRFVSKFGLQKVLNAAPSASILSENESNTEHVSCRVRTHRFTSQRITVFW